MGSIQLKRVKKSFGKVDVIHGVDLQIEDGDFVVFVGPSGCGKSTLLRLIAGLEDITSGELHIGGENVTLVPPAKRGVAMVFQSYALYPHMTVYDNMAFGLKLAKDNTQAERDARVREAAKILQLEQLLERKPKELSGGQRQRVAIGRAIVRKPRVFLFDEPLSNLDAALRVQMRIELAQLHEELKTTMVYVTHDQVEALTLADKIVVLNSGRVEQVGSPLGLYHHPANLFVAGFIGSPKMNTLSVKVAKVLPEEVAVRTNGGVALSLPVSGAGLSEGQIMTLGVRPEHLRAVDVADGPLLSGKIQVIERLGEASYLYVESDSRETVVVKADGESTHQQREAVKVAINPEDCHLFDADGQAVPRLSKRSYADVAA